MIICAGDRFRGDPGAHAAARLQAFEVCERSLRTTAGVALAALAVIAPFVAQPVTGDSGAVVGAVVLALLLAGLAAAAWPYEWTAAERSHREL